ncbi:TrmH family RNA methyltransferase [Parasporobacterium paucivorans]|uniref:RNA methyltransferase, TrmH family n=1 Tax=Parasporobacterium paucivorans DSM 15970 TaxID=1122934 RepID=A0A1M6JQZ2_9FIRM|nr:RNA methyltransferase [Parasporobacterium paucivorans]SHJ49119.1 RNA methyltransferase, TrmH family [Parasporobacterium paucivorans DSM 15970]
MISSAANSRIKNIVQIRTKSSARSEQNAYVVEGKKMFLEIPPEDILEVYVSEGFEQEGENQELLGNLSYEAVSDKVFKSISDTVTPQGILALVRMKHYTLKDMKNKNRNIYLVLENVRDPGNLGTMVRTGEGAGISGIIMSRETVDIYNPKVIRSTMGSIFRVPFLYTDNLTETILEMKKDGIRIYTAHLKGESLYERSRDRQDAAIIIGNESAGVSNGLAGLSDALIRIPMCGRVESLNAAVSAALLMYDFLWNS